jgi:hypothetical protein
MANVGSFVVNTYMNNDNFLAGVKSATAGAKKMETGIGDSINRINEKQLKGVASGFVKNFLGPVSAINMGGKVAADLISGFSNGIYKDVGDVAEAFGKTFSQAISSVPIAGAFFEVGTAIGNWAFGIDEANKSLEESKKQLADVGKFYKSMTDRQNLEESVTGGLVKQASQLGMSPEEIARADALAKLQTTGSVEGTNREDFIKTQMDLYDQATAQIKIFNENQAIDKKNKDDLIAAQSALSQLEMEAHQINMSARDIELERLAIMEGMDMTMLSQAMAAWDQVEAARQAKDLAAENLKFRQDANKEALDGEKDLFEAQQAYAETEAALNAQAAGTSNVQGLSTAIGSIKVAGSTDFSIEKQMDIAKQQLNATELHTDILQEIADSLNAMGGTT